MIPIDKINGMLYASHDLGSAVKTLNSTPCSICKKWIEDNPNRDVVPRIEMDDIHFHGSELNACERKVFLNYLNGNKMSFSESTFLLDGHMHESSVLRNIEAGLPDGWKILIFENNGETIKDVLGFKLVTHMDAVISNNEILIGLECKAVREKNFKKYENGDVDDIWYGQVHSYMFNGNIELFYLIVKSRDTSKIHIPIKVERDNNFLAARLNALKDVAYRLTQYKEVEAMRQPDRKYGSSKNMECTYCAFKSTCWKE